MGLVCSKRFSSEGEQAVRATIQHYRQTEEALSECHLRGFTSIFSLSPGPSLFFCLHSDNLCNTHKGNSKKRSFGDLRGVGCPPAGGGGSALPVLLIEWSVKKQLLTLFFLPVVCRSVPSLWGVEGGVEEGNNAKTVHPSEKCVGWFWWSFPLSNRLLAIEENRWRNSHWQEAPK